MSVIEDVRQVLQDFLAPELRAITTRLDALDQRFVDLATVMNARSNALDQRIVDLATVMNARFEAMNTRFDSVSKEIAQVKELLEIDRRLSRLEAKQSQVAQ